MMHESAVTLFRNVFVYDPAVATAMRGSLDVLIEGGLITTIAEAIEPPAGARQITGTDHLLMPGLVNAHFHSSVNHMKGRLPGLPLEIFMLYESPALDVLTPTPREAYLRTMLAAIEMLKSGTTSVQDDAFFGCLRDASRHERSTRPNFVINAVSYSACLKRANIPAFHFSENRLASQSCIAIFN